MNNTRIPYENYRDINTMLIPFFPQAITNIIIAHQLPHPMLQFEISILYNDDTDYDELFRDLDDVDEPGCISSVIAKHYFLSENSRYETRLYNIEWYCDDEKVEAIARILDKHFIHGWEIAWKNIHFMKYPKLVYPNSGLLGYPNNVLFGKIR